MQLKNEIIIKKIIIEWIKPPASFKIEFCDFESNCIVKQYKNLNIIQLRSNLFDIYQKLFKMRIMLTPDLESHINYCIFSIKRISLFKNEILLDPILTSELNGEEANPQLFYSDNFLLSKIDNVALGIDIQSKLTQNILISDTIPENIIDVFNSLKNQIKDKKRNSLNGLIYNTESYYQEYKNKNKQSVKLIKNLFLHLEKFNAKPFSSFINEFKQETVEKIKDYKSELEKIQYSINGQEDNNEVEIKLSVIKNSNYNETNIDTLVENNYKLIEQESAYFDETNTDKYRYKLNAKLKFLKYLSHIYKKIDFYSIIKNTFIPNQKILSNMENYNGKWTEKMYKIIDEYYSNFTQIKNSELNSVMKRLEISLQNIKLIRRSETLNHLRIFNKNINPKTSSQFGIECKEIKIIRNSYYDNFFAKLLVNYNQTNFESENIIIVKFINLRFYYYLKIYYSKIELWNKDLDNNNLIGEYDIYTESDKFNIVKDFSKLLFILVKIHKGEISLSVKIEYNPIPEEIINYLNDINIITYDKVIKFYMEDYNKFQEYYKNSKILYEGKDINLVKQILHPYLSKQFLL